MSLSSSAWACLSIFFPLQSVCFSLNSSESVPNAESSFILLLFKKEIMLLGHHAKRQHQRKVSLSRNFVSLSGRQINMDFRFLSLSLSRSVHVYFLSLSPSLSVDRIEVDNDSHSNHLDRIWTILMLNDQAQIN